MSIIIKKGDLLEATEQYIIQQCNCVSVNSHGLSESIAEKFPYANYYKKRRKLGRRNLAIEEDHSIPGTIEVCGDGKENRYIINAFAQYGMSKPYTFNNKDKNWNDGFPERLKWFEECLEKVKNLKPESVAFPWKIGCGLAGGNWNRDYFPLITKWSEENPEIKVVFYQL